MKIDIVERGGYKVSQRLDRILREKLERLGKYFDDEPNAKVVCQKEAKQEKLEITITSKGLLFRSEVISDNMYDNIDIALPKLEKQIVRNREKKIDAKKKKNEFEFIYEMPEVKLPEVFKKKSFNLDPMSEDEAKDAIERLGHTFYIFLNAESGKVNVLYRRNDGKFGLIEVNY